MRQGDKVYIKEKYREYVNPLKRSFDNNASNSNDKIWNIFDLKERFANTPDGKVKVCIDYDIEYNGMIVLKVPEEYLESVQETRERKINEIIK